MLDREKNEIYIHNIVVEIIPFRPFTLNFQKYTLNQTFQNFQNHCYSNDMIYSILKKNA